MRTVFAFAFLGLSLGGCGIGADIASPELEVPTSFRESSVKGALHPTWPTDFAVFRSAHLTDLIARTRASNLDVGAAIARFQQAEAQVRIAFQPLIPTIQADGNAQRSFSHANGRAIKTNVFNAELTASYIVDIWGRNTSAYNAARASAEASNFDALTIAIMTDSTVANTYFNAVGAQKQLQIAKENLAIAERTQQAIRARNKAGTASGLDVAQQETLTANVRVTIPPLERNLQQYKHALAVLTGVAPEFFQYRGEDLFAIRVPRLQPGLPSELLYRRPDVAFAEAQLAAAKFNVASARAAMFPTIQLTGSGGFESAALSSLFQPQSTFYNMALGLTQPLTNELQLQAIVDQNRARYTELLQDYRKAIVSAFRDVDDALIAYRKNAEQERLQNMAVVSARRAFQISEAQLRGGVIDLTTLLSVQQTLFNAENALVTVRVARLQSAVSLYQALGGGWQKPTDVSIAEIKPVIELRAKTQ